MNLFKFFFDNKKKVTELTVNENKNQSQLNPKVEKSNSYEYKIYCFIKEAYLKNEISDENILENDIFDSDYKFIRNLYSGTSSEKEIPKLWFAFYIVNTYAKKIINLYPVLSKTDKNEYFKNLLDYIKCVVEELSYLEKKSELNNTFKSQLTKIENDISELGKMKAKYKDKEIIDIKIEIENKLVFFHELHQKMFCFINHVNSINNFIQMKSKFIIIRKKFDFLISEWHSFVLRAFESRDVSFLADFLTNLHDVQETYKIFIKKLNVLNLNHLEKMLIVANADLRNLNNYIEFLDLFVDSVKLEKMSVKIDHLDSHKISFENLISRLNSNMELNCDKHRKFDSVIFEYWNELEHITGDKVTELSNLNIEDGLLDIASLDDALNEIDDLYYFERYTAIE